MPKCNFNKVELLLLLLLLLLLILLLLLLLLLFLSFLLVSRLLLFATSWPMATATFCHIISTETVAMKLLLTVRKVSVFRVFLVHIFPQSHRIRKDTSYLSVFSLNVGKYGPEKTPYLDTFHAVRTTENKEV